MNGNLNPISSAPDLYNRRLQKVPENFGGVISSKTIANLESLGQDPEGAFKIGRTVVYPTESLLEWLQQRTTFLSSGYEDEEVE